MRVIILVFLVDTAVLSGLVVQATPLLPKRQPQRGSNVVDRSGLFLPQILSQPFARAPPSGGIVATNATAHSSGLSCGVTSQVNSGTDKYEKCPGACPYFAQNREDALHCTFLCVKGEDCAQWNHRKPIPDTVKNSRNCRGPKVKFCTELTLDGTDSCLRCQTFFDVWPIDGQCYFAHWTALIVGSCITVVLLVVVTSWIVDWCMRPTINAKEVVRGESHRSRAKVLMQKGSPNFGDGPRRRWPSDTNLCTTDVAGHGMVLHFNFQAFFIAWPLVVAIVWTILICFHHELAYLGLRKFGTPRHNCILVAWGYETQHRLMWTKNLFLLIVYLFSFISFLVFSVRQARIYQRMDFEQKSMKEFAVEVTGLPQIRGDQNAEMLIKKAVEDAVPPVRPIVGVSVAWNFMDNVDEVMAIIAEEQEEAEKKYQQSLGTYQAPDDDTSPPENMHPLRKKMYGYEKWLLGYGEDGSKPPKNASEKEALLNQLVSSGSAFVVFHGLGEAAAAIEESERGAIKLTYEGEEYTLVLSKLDVEPATVNWHNFGDTSGNAMMKRFFKALLMYYVPALAVWFIAFYVPYAVMMYNFNYENGAEPPGYYSLIFTMVVVGGNATMYVICDIIGDKIGLKFKDSKQTIYMILYLVACMINVLLDMVVTYFTALKVMRGLDFRNYFGTRLDDIHSFTEQFETYAMQRSLGGNTYAYAFPSTFLIPFLLEPIVTILVPYQIGKLIVRTHKEVQGADAEAFLVSFDFDLGRYADILLNVFLGILIFWFPGGYIWYLFYGMFISHIVIYLFDHWRVLNVIPQIRIVSQQVDWWAQVTMAGCCGMILSCLVFKMNCESYAGYCLEDVELVGACTLAGVVHFAVHTLLLVYLVPILGRVREDADDSNFGKVWTYETIAQNDPKTWFSMNPVHCLRTQYCKHCKPKDGPFCRYAATGKEHLLEANPKIGCYFKDVAAAVEDFDAKDWLHDIERSASKEIGTVTKRASQIFTEPATKEAKK